MARPPGPDPDSRPAVAAVGGAVIHVRVRPIAVVRRKKTWTVGREQGDGGAGGQKR
ncbi:MAG: hypothetical protein JWN08_2214 [Frankiales bacterium]|nr:hypothetical protein [Frankiales bacterium]